MKIIDFEAHMYTEDFFQIMEKRVEEGQVPFFDKETGFMYHVSKTEGLLQMAPLRESLVDIGEKRVEKMNQNDISTQLLSCSIGIEQLPSSQSVKLSKKVHNCIYEATKRFPNRFRGYATLPVDETEESIKELERCVKDLGFIGWNAFSNCNGRGIDERKYFPIMKKCEELNVPMYIHPAVPFIDRLLGCGPQLYSAGYGFSVDVSISLLRMMCSGVFDELPNLKVIIGHLGENLPSGMDRLNKKSVLYKSVQYPATNIDRLEDYFKRNVWVTTSGNYSLEALRSAINVLGIDKILFGSDYPMETLEDMRMFLNNAGLSEEEKKKIFYENAENLLS